MKGALSIILSCLECCDLFIKPKPNDLVSLRVRLLAVGCWGLPCRVRLLDGGGGGWGFSWWECRDDVLGV